MVLRLSNYFTVAALLLMGCVFAAGQSADGSSSIYGKSNEDRDRPKGIAETLQKFRIQKAKKEFDQMIARGEEAQKISSELENAFAQNGRLSEREIAKVETVEKLVKKIRSELGGDDDDNDKTERTQSEENPISHGDAIKSLRSTTVELFEQLKKTTRFTISAAAIQTSNAVIRLARLLRISK